MKNSIKEAWFPVDFSFCLSEFVWEKYGFESQSCLTGFVCTPKEKKKPKNST